jgi:hypothetical protein
MFIGLGIIFRSIIQILKTFPLKVLRWIYLKFRKRYIELFLYIDYLEIMQSRPYLLLRDIYINKIKENDHKKTNFIIKWFLILIRKPFLIFELYPIVYLTDRFFREQSRYSLFYKRIYLRKDYRAYDLFLIFDYLIIVGGLISLNIRTLGQYYFMYMELTFFFFINLLSQFFFGLHIEKLLDNWISLGLYTKCRAFILYEQTYLDLNLWSTPNAYWLYYSLFAVCLLSAIQVITAFEDFSWYMISTHGFAPSTPYLIFGDTNEDGPLFGIASVVKAFIFVFIVVNFGYPHLVIFSGVYLMFYMECLWVGYQTDFPIDEELGGDLVKKEQLRDRIFEMMQNSSELLSGSYRREQIFEYFLKEKFAPLQKALIDSVEPTMLFIMNCFSKIDEFLNISGISKIYRKLIPSGKTGNFFLLIYNLENLIQVKWNAIVTEYTENNFQVMKENVAELYEFVIYRGFLIFDLRIGGETKQDYEDYFDGQFDRHAIDHDERQGVEDTQLEEEEFESFYKEVYMTRAAEGEELLNLRAERDRLAVLEDFVPDIREQVIKDKITNIVRERAKAAGYIEVDVPIVAEPEVKLEERKPKTILDLGSDLGLDDQHRPGFFIQLDAEALDIYKIDDSKTQYTKKFRKILGLNVNKGSKMLTNDPFDHQQRIQSQSEEHIDEIDMEVMVEEYLSQQSEHERDVLGQVEEDNILASRRRRMSAIYIKKKLNEEWPWIKAKDEVEDDIFEDIFNRSDIPYEIYTKYLRWQIMAPFFVVNAIVLILLGPEAFPYSEIYNFYDLGCPESIDANRPYSVTEYFWLFDQWWWLGDEVFETYIDTCIPALFSYRLYELIKMDALLEGFGDKIEPETHYADEFWKKYLYLKDKLCWALVEPYVMEYWGYVKLYFKMIIDIIIFIWYNYILWEILEIKDFYIEAYHAIMSLF